MELFLRLLTDLKKKGGGDLSFENIENPWLVVNERAFNVVIVVKCALFCFKESVSICVGGNWITRCLNQLVDILSVY